MVPGTEVGHSHRLHCKKSPAEVVLPSPAEEIQPATGAAETVLLSRHWVCPVHFNNCVVWFSYKIRHQKTTENGSDCWKDYWYSPAHPSRTVYIQSEEKGSENHSGSLTPKLPHLWTLAIWPALQSRKYQDSQAQEQFLPPGNLPHEQLNVPHLYNKNVQYPYIYLLPLHPSTSLHLTQSNSIIIYSTIVYTLIYLQRVFIFYFFDCVLLSFVYWKLMSLKQIPCMRKHTWQ